MDYEAVGNSDLFWGTVLVAGGAIVVSVGWFLLGICKWTDERLKTWRGFKTAIMRRSAIGLVVAILILGGSIVVAKGGTLTTKGWNFISFGQQRKNLIRAITAEWLSNNACLAISPMKGEPYYVKEGGVYVWWFFPTLRSNALNTISSSGFWDYGNQMDKKFLDTVAVYEMTISSANRKFRNYDDSLSNIKDPNERIMQTKKLGTLTREKEWFKSLEDWQNNLGKLIWSECRWAIETQPEVYELLRKRFQEKSTVSEPAEALPKKQQ
jgi:hypothetical protein